MILTIEDIRKRLQDKRLSYISKTTGIHHNQLLKLRNGAVTNPRYEVVKKLSEYFNDYHFGDGK